MNAALKTVYATVEPFITKDGSHIRELMHPVHHAALGVRAQSFAEAIVGPGMKTLLHYHETSEEIYHITQGSGRMTLGEAQFEVNPGDTICIVPGTPHAIECLSAVPLKILCACSPPYQHEDTKVV